MRLSAACLLLPLGLAGAPPPPAGGPAPAAATAPARADDWVLKLFTKEGWLSEVLRGTEVRPHGDDRIDLVDMNITVLSGDAANRIDTILLSPSASYYPREDRAAGTGGVRVIRDDCEITGRDWTYEEAGKKVSIHGHVHVAYHSSLNGLAP